VGVPPPREDGGPRRFCQCAPARPILIGGWDREGAFAPSRFLFPETVDLEKAPEEQGRGEDRLVHPLSLSLHDTNIK